METKRKSIERVALRYGLRCGIVLIFLFLISYFFQSEFGDFYFMGKFFRFTDLGIIKYFNLPVIFYSIYRGTRYFKIRYNYCVITYQKSVLSGIYISFLSITIVSIFSIIFYKFIDPTSLKFVLATHYFRDIEVTPVQRAINFLRPYSMTFFISVIYTILLSIFLKKGEHSH